MTDLLEFALDAHGGLDRWNALSRLTTQLSITGGIWYVKSKPDVFADVALTADLHTERVLLAPVGAADRVAVLDGGSLTQETTTGEVLERRDDPEASYIGHHRDTPWDDLHAAYFACEALWTYLTTPFLYTYSGVQTVEVEPWHEDGEVWRSLQITFPDSIATHTTTQISRFGPDGLLRRHDYTVDILAGATGANYAYDFEDVDGIMIPMRRRVWAYDEATHQKVPDPLLVAIDVRSASFQ